MNNEQIRAILNSAFEGCIWGNTLSGDANVNDFKIEGKEEFFDEVIRQLNVQDEVPGKLDIWKAEQ